MIVKERLLYWAVKNRKFIAKAIFEAIEFIKNNNDPITLEYREYEIIVRKKV